MNLRYRIMKSVDLDYELDNEGRIVSDLINTENDATDVSNQLVEGLNGLSFQNILDGKEELPEGVEVYVTDLDIVDGDYRKVV